MEIHSCSDCPFMEESILGLMGCYNLSTEEERKKSHKWFQFESKNYSIYPECPLPDVVEGPDKETTHDATN